MAFSHGKNSTLVVNSGTMTAFLNDISFPRSVDTAETTVFGLGAKTYLPGLVDGTLSGSGGYDPTASTGPIAILEAVLVGGAAVTVVYKPGGASSTNYSYSMSAILTSYEIASSTSDWITISFEFQVTGAVTPTVL